MILLYSVWQPRPLTNPRRQVAPNVQVQWSAVSASGPCIRGHCCRLNACDGCVLGVGEPSGKLRSHGVTSGHIGGQPAVAGAAKLRAGRRTQSLKFLSAAGHGEGAGGGRTGLLQPTFGFARGHVGTWGAGHLDNGGSSCWLSPRWHPCALRSARCGSWTTRYCTAGTAPRRPCGCGHAHGQLL